MLKAIIENDGNTLVMGLPCKWSFMRAQLASIGGELTHLLECLNLKDYLFLPKNDYFLDSIEEKIAFLEDGLANNLKMWRKYRMNVDAYYDDFCQCVAVSTVRMQAQSNQLFYHYDYFCI